MPRGRHRASLDHVSEFDRGKIAAYSDCGLSFKEIGQRVVLKQTTVMRIRHRWMQGKTMVRLNPIAHPPRCTPAYEDRWIVRMTVMDHEPHHEP
ncbi:HTH_38 domain-containing protein [Trichonephila clavipes]|nr:HTH_38 domain-containing protein [Trichonephila clavipes]